MTWKFGLAALFALASASAGRFSLEQVMSAPFPSELTVSRTAGKVAWVLDESGARNIWVAEAPDYKGRRLTHFTADDGQEIAQISWTPDGRSVIYVRGVSSAAIPWKPTVFGKPSISPGLLRVPSELML